MLARVRESVMDILGPTIRRAAVLDLFAGAGSLGLEALSRGATHVVFVESDPGAAKALTTNLEELRFTPQATILACDAFLPRFPPGISWPFGLVFLDPPYEDVRTAENAHRLTVTLRGLLQEKRLLPGARLVLHLPLDSAFEAGGALPLVQADERTYGRTRILFLTLPSVEEVPKETP